MRIIEDASIVIGVENELKIWIIDNLLDFVYVKVVIDIFQLEAKLEILIVKDANLRLRIVAEIFDHPCRIDQICIKKWR